MRTTTESRVLCQHVQQLVNLQSIKCNHLLILDIIGRLYSLGGSCHVSLALFNGRVDKTRVKHINGKSLTSHS